MSLEELKKEIVCQIGSVKEAADIKNYFVLFGYGYPNFSVHLEVSSLQLALMFYRASFSCETLRKAIVLTAETIKETQEGGEK